MPIWNDIRKQSAGIREREEDKIPIFICHTTDGKHLSIDHPEVEFLGRMDGHSYNSFYPEGLGEYYRVRENFRFCGIDFGVGDTIIGYQDSHYHYDYYLYGRKVIPISRKW